MSLITYTIARNAAGAPKDARIGKLVSFLKMKNFHLNYRFVVELATYVGYSVEDAQKLWDAADDPMDMDDVMSVDPIDVVADNGYVAPLVAATPESSYYSSLPPVSDSSEEPGPIFRKQLNKQRAKRV